MRIRGGQFEKVGMMGMVATVPCDLTTPSCHELSKLTATMATFAVALLLPSLSSERMALHSAWRACSFSPFCFSLPGLLSTWWLQARQALGNRRLLRKPT